MKAVAVFGAMVLVAVAAGALFSRYCSGPRPEVVSIEVAPPDAAGAPYVVRVEVRNRGRGSGEVEVDARLRDAWGTSFEASTTLDLAGHTSEVALLELAAPEADYTAAATVVYPPR